MKTENCSIIFFAIKTFYNFSVKMKILNMFLLPHRPGVYFSLTARKAFRLAFRNEHACVRD